MLLIINDKRIMGQHINGKIFNLIAITTAVVVMSLSVGLLITTFLPTG
jgi:Mn2+/Fe2+ NRAMP family transporter